MTEFKQGERVKVEFEALALPESSIAGDSWLLVGIPGTQLFTSVRKEHCTLIEPEIVLPEIPGTVILIHGNEMRVWAYQLGTDGIWYAHNGGTIANEDLLLEMRPYGYRVIPAATEEVENV